MATKSVPTESRQKSEQAAGADAGAYAERLRERQNAYLARMALLWAQAHPYARRVFAERGLTPEDFRTVDDIPKLPPMTKQDYIRDPEVFRLDASQASGLILEERTIADVIYTAGSTGDPTPFYDTVHDRFARIDLLGRGARIAGIGPDDTVMNLFPLSAVPHQGYLSATWGAMATGSKLLSAHTGRAYADFPVHRRMDEAIDLSESQRATVLWGITSYVRQVILRAEERGRDFSAVRLVMAMGEPCPSAMRDDMRARLTSLGSPYVTVNNGYGMTELMGPSTECRENGGAHLPAPEQFYIEVVDPETYIPVPDGARGLLVLTHLNRRGTVLLRYVAGDVVALTRDQCPHCGRFEPRFLGSPYRVDGLTKVKGTLVNPAMLLEGLSGLLSRGVKEYQIVISREVPGDPLSADELRVRAACAEEDQARLQQEITATVRAETEISPAIEFLPADGFGEIAGGYKFKRFVDERADTV
ncbi:MAG: phenylacetate--CoA ligase family protein [Chloroflexi bacterium]|nr:phenylacetate--CoA ligase family protein [Chloroflexota bacterium]